MRLPIKNTQYLHHAKKWCNRTVIMYVGYSRWVICSRSLSKIGDKCCQCRNKLHGLLPKRLAKLWELMLSWVLLASKQYLLGTLQPCFDVSIQSSAVTSIVAGGRQLPPRELELITDLAYRWLFTVCLSRKPDPQTPARIASSIHVPRALYWKWSALWLIGSKL